MLIVKSNNLEAEMKRIGITRNDIASVLGISYRTAHSRFNGDSQWQYTECVLVRDKFFPNMELSYLFPCCEQQDKQELV